VAVHRLLKEIGIRSFNYGGDQCTELAKRLLEAGPGGRLLDLGCGGGSITMEFAGLMHADEVRGIEYVDECLDEAVRRGIACSKADLNQAWDLPDGHFDLVLSTQNIEHVHNTRLYLEECRRVLKLGGQLLITTENLSSWVNVAAVVLGWQPFSAAGFSGWTAGVPPMLQIEESAPADDFVERWHPSGVSGAMSHIRVLAYRGLRDLLTLAGFQRVSVFSRGYPPFWGRPADVLARLDRRHGHFLVATGYKE